MRRTAEESAMLRKWARENSIDVKDKGAIAIEVVWVWIKAHEGIRPNVIRQWRYDAGATRHVEILCYKCARIHSDYVLPGSRGNPTRISRNISCSENYGGLAYEYRDYMPLMNWELIHITNQMNQAKQPAQTEGTNNETD